VLGADAAAPLYAALADSRDYYGYLAADRLHRGYDLRDQPSVDDTALQAALAQRPGLLRAHELFACDLYDDAVAEWATALAGSAPAVKIQAARLAASWGWYAQSIATLASAGEWDDVRLRYPRPYTPQVAAAGELVRLPPDWILAVMRQESLFRSDAVSRANARGLMQLLPSTARQIAQRWQPSLEGTTLFDPATAVTLGAAHLRELLDRFQGQLALALAAYNAGSQSLSRWLPAAPMSADIWIENIPYDETRGYVQHILEHIVAYAFTRHATPPQLATLLPPVQMTSAVCAANSAPARR
jgi:soluble lytic murein transglycosylase